MLAWFDLHLRDGRPAERDRAAPGRAARRDGGRSSIGTGARGPDGGNAPYLVAGEKLADHLSFYYPSDLAAAGLSCLDLRVQRCSGTPALTAPPTPPPPPEAPACVSRRRFAIHLRGGRRLARARVTVAGKRVRVRRVRRRLVAVVDLRGMPRRTVVVRVVARTRGGRVVRERRRYRTCRPNPRRPRAQSHSTR